MTIHTLSDPIDILLVEDNPGDVRLTKEAFSEIATETTITVVSDGTEALDVLSERCASATSTIPDLILLDLNLPRMSGFEFLETVEDDPDFANVPVLVLTSSKAAEDVHKSYQRSANAYLTKPTDPDRFVSVAKAVENFWFKQAALPPICS